MKRLTVRTAHLSVLLACLALAAYAASFLLGDPSAPAILAWFLGAAVAYDLVLFPLSALADRILTRLPRPRLPLVNHVRLPLLGAGLTFVMFLPGILRQSEPTHLAATGLSQQPYLARWLWLVLMMFLLSAAIYLVRLAISRRRGGTDATNTGSSHGYPPGDHVVRGGSAVKYQDLVESVRDQAGLDSTAEARETVQAVLATLAHCLPPADRQRVAEHLPGSLEPAADVPGPPEIRDGTDLVVEVSRRLKITSERARYRSQAVLSALRAGDADLADYLHSRLSSTVLAVLTPAGQPPRRAASVRSEVPTELSDAEIDQALHHLTGWTGDHTGIARTIQLPPDRLTPLINRVQRVARELNDHANIERGADTVTVRLTTGRPGVVTEPDLQLAERIDQAVAEFGSGGRP